MKIPIEWLYEHLENPIDLQLLLRKLPKFGFNLSLLDDDETQKKVSTKEQIIDCEITPNRGDCASVLGLTREIAAIFQKKVKYPQCNEIATTSNHVLEVEVLNPNCPIYTGRIIKKIDPTKKTPSWMKKRLNQSGITTVSAIVDILNYVMLLCGQPMHGFDLAKIDKKIVVRLAKDGEKLRLLNNQEVNLTTDTLIISDQSSPIGIAGVIGGMDSAITFQTEDLFLESAHFKPQILRGKAKQYNLITEASYRFERGVDYKLPHKALNLATTLIMDICGGNPGKLIVVDNLKSSLKLAKEIRLHNQEIDRILGEKITAIKVKNILENIDCQVEMRGTTLIVKVPSYRFDLNLEIDLIEEVGRFYGIDEILPDRSNDRVYKFQTEDICSEEKFDSENRLRLVMKTLGYNEVISYPFLAQKEEREFNLNNLCSLSLQNPLSDTVNMLRTSHWPNLIKIATYNLKRQKNRIRIYEIGTGWSKDRDKFQEFKMLSGLIYGNIYHEQWGIKGRMIDFFDIKKDIAHILKSLNSECKYKKLKNIDNLTILHPQIGARIITKKEDKTVGYLGLLHPQLQIKYKFLKNIYLFEIYIDELSNYKSIRYKPYSKFPQTRRDIAFVIKESVSIEKICELITSNFSQYLSSLIIFDVYRGKEIDKGQKSIGLGLVLQKNDATLIDSEVDKVIKDITTSLKLQFNAQIRE